jgi:hypothetical protein
MLLLPLKNLTGSPADAEDLRAERAAARSFGRVALGDEHLFLYRILGLGGGYIRYADIDRWYIRQIEATVEVSEFYSYMFVVEYEKNGKYEEFAINYEEKKKIDALREAFAQAHPELTFGRHPSRKSKLNW